ncbi:MAG: ABC transporter ATP-binding protein [Chitinophagaceae bacterium]
MVELKEISKRFGKLQVLDKVSMQMNAGECVALIGPNGCGKTTLIKSILGMVVPESGGMTFAGKSIIGEWAYRDKIGYMPQIGRYPEAATIGQVIAMMKDIRSASKLDESLIDAFNLRPLYQKRTGTLSGGTRQKLSAALAFLFQPEMLILDEPTAGLDPVSAEQLRDKILEEKGKGKLILITSHVLSDLDDLVTEVAFMQDGKLQLHQSIEQLKEETGESRLQKAIAAIMQTTVQA